MGDQHSVIKLVNISKSFGKQEVLKDISLDIPKGKIFGILGASGSGKSTLLKIITGNLLPDKGDVLFEPKSVAKYSLFEQSVIMQSIHKNVSDLKRTVGYSPQTPSFYDKLTCEENLRFFGSTYQIPKDILNVNKTILLKLVGLDVSKDKLASDLSGGMQKRLDLACSLVHDPDILVLDEPTSDLDFMLREQMWDLIKKIKNKGTSIIMSSHFLEEIEGLCDQIIILNNSSIEFIGSPEELKQRDTSGIILKIQTVDKKYDFIISKIEKRFSTSVCRVHENTGYLIVSIPKLKNSTEEVIRIMRELEHNNQKVTDFIVSKEGISEVFQKIHQASYENSVMLEDKESKLNDDASFKKYGLEIMNSSENISVQHKPLENSSSQNIPSKKSFFSRLFSSKKSKSNYLDGNSSNSELPSFSSSSNSKNPFFLDPVSKDTSSETLSSSSDSLKNSKKSISEKKQTEKTNSSGGKK